MTVGLRCLLNCSATMATDLAGRRLGVLALVGVALFAMLGARLYFLQVMQPETFEAEVLGNRARTVYTEAPRGRIVDAKDRVLAGRRESLVVTLDWTTLRDAEPETRADVFGVLAAELSEAGIKTKVGRLESLYTRSIDGALKPVVVADDVGEELWVRLSEANLVGVGVHRQWVRTYPYGSIGAHIVGYTGRVRDSEIADELNDTSEKIYFAGDEVGIAGLERVYENVLRGTPEIRRVEVDAQNRIVQTIEVVQEGKPGQDIVLSLDIDLQYAAEQILADELVAAQNREESEDSLPHIADSGSLVAVDVNDGSVVALASYPTFDPRDFIFGISSSLWDELSNRSDLPLLDRTTRGNYPAGSTFKPFVAYTAMDSNARDQFFTWIDEGSYTLESCIDPENVDGGCKFRNAGSAVLGPVQMRDALERSSDTYFYSLGEKFWIQQDTYGRTAIQDTAELFGFGSRSQIDLPSQSAGRVPTPENRIEQFGEDARWYPGDNVNLAIGQGDLLVTPLQLTNAYAMLATGGTRYEPRLVASIIDEDGVETPVEPVVAADVPLDPEILAPIYDGLQAVVNPTLGTGRGTATDAFVGFPLNNYQLVGKTGTAEVRNKADFSLFAAFGPWPEPEYAVAAVLEQAGFGGDAAAPAVRRLFDMLAGNVPIPVAPVAEDRLIDVFGFGEFDLAAALAMAGAEIAPPNSESAPATSPPATSPPPTDPTSTVPQSTETTSTTTSETSTTVPDSTTTTGQASTTATTATPPEETSSTSGGDP